MEFKESDPLKLPFNVIGEIDYRSEYPSLKDIPEFKEEVTSKLPVDFDPLFKYFVLLYTPNTPLLNVKDFAARKNIALEISGMLRDPDLFEGREADLIYLLMIAYLRMMNSNKWAKLCVFQNSYYNLMIRLQSGKTEPGERTKDLIINIDDLGKKVDDLITDLANGDFSARITTNVLQAIEDLRRELTPEYIAQQTLEGNDPTRAWNPHAN